MRYNPPMVREIIQIGNPLLTQVSSPVPENELQSKKIQSLIQDMLDTCKHHDKDTAGLSAVQIGEPVRIYVARRIDVNEDIWEVFINPELEILDSEEGIMWEGCMSIGEGDNRLFAPVARANKVKVTYTKTDGTKAELVATDYMAHIVQHEQDHLNGKLFLQYVDDPRKVWKNKDLDEYLEEHGQYPSV